MRLALAPLLAAAWIACGCHVVERSEHCQQLSSLMKRAEPELNATKIPDDPPSKSLRKKARLYGQLGEKLEKVPVKDPKVKEVREATVKHLRNLEKDFLDAAESVEEQKKYIERQKKREERVAARVDKAKVRVPVKAPLPDATVGKEAGAAPQSDKTDQTSLTGKARHAAPGVRRPSQILRTSTPHSRRYARAKRSIESSGVALKSTQKRLEKACR